MCVYLRLRFLIYHWKWGHFMYTLWYVIILSASKQEYLHIFSVKLFIQWEALDYPFITSMECSQLYPLVGRISATERGKTYDVNVRKIDFVTCHLAWPHRVDTNVTIFMPCLRVAIIGIMEQDSARCKSLTKTTQALTALNLEVIILGDKNEWFRNWFNYRVLAFPSSLNGLWCIAVSFLLIL